MPHTSLREAGPTALLSTSAQCPMPNAQCCRPCSVVGVATTCLGGAVSRYSQRVRCCAESF
ncbi:hypothetical protein H1Q63_10155 [Desmonostoc muscorum CCALA 125]|nr:hypothetical protein [Desmonostoc muscorum CCALA 125]